VVTDAHHTVGTFCAFKLLVHLRAASTPAMINKNVVHLLCHKHCHIGRSLFSLAKEIMLPKRRKITNQQETSATPLDPHACAA